LFRINAGKGWAGKVVSRSRDQQGRTLLVLRDAIPFQAAPPGWPDLAGWESVTITSDMIGKKVAIWYGEEIKVTGRQSGIQKKFQGIIEKMGGIYKLIGPRD
jgi:hypothetical protein